jgi:AraC-like DNA-binding protein
MESCSISRVNPVTKHETVDHSAAFPYHSDCCDLHDYPGNQFSWHWHREIEIFYMREGRLEYALPGGNAVFEAGDGGFLNSNVLHLSSCRQEDACRQEEQQFLPELIGGFPGSLVMQKYVQPVLEAPGLTLLPLRAGEAAHAPLLDAICRAYEASQSGRAGYELEVQSALLDFWLALYRLSPSFAPRRNAAVDDQRIKRMIAYIAAHYGDKLSLGEIAQAAYLSPRACNRCFQEQLGTTPFGYLLEYRVQKARELLLAGTEPVGEIALQCGFGSSSYFGKIFLEKTGMTPSDCRKKR